jgi:hypothetical protein
MKNKIIVHAVFHKTGTTALQVKLSEHQLELQKLGIRYPEIEEKDHVDKRSGYSGNENFINQVLSDANSAYCPENADSHIILSAENLCHFRNGLKLIWLVKFLNKLGSHDVEVVFTYKASCDMAISHYREFCKNNSAPYGYFWFFILRSLHFLILMRSLKSVSRVSFVDTTTGAISAFSRYLSSLLTLKEDLNLREEHVYQNKHVSEPAVNNTSVGYVLLRLISRFIFVPLNKKVDLMTSNRDLAHDFERSMQFAGKNASSFRVNVLLLKDVAKSVYRSVRYI